MSKGQCVDFSVDVEIPYLPIVCFLVIFSFFLFRIFKKVMKNYYE